MNADNGSRLATFGENVRKYRDLAGFSQKALALEAGLTQHAISEIEAGKRDPRLSTVYRLTEALGTDIESLF